MLTRHLSKVLQKRLQLAKSVYLFGARQVGKTTTLRQTFPELPYRSLEDPDQEQAAVADPKGFLSQFQSTGAILDELQRVPDLFRYLQGFIDQHAVKFVLSGSQNFLLNQHISQSLAGRISILEMMPLSYREIYGQSAKAPLFPAQDWRDDKQVDLHLRLWQGGYPQPGLNAELANFWFADYERTYLERDVRLLINVTNLQKFGQFMRMLAHRAGALLNVASLANELGISENSCRQWIGILEASGVVFRLLPYHRNYNKRLVKSPKVFFNDTGLLCYLLGISEPQILQNHASSGHIFENYVIAEIRKYFLNRGQRPNLFFWRDKTGTEVDLLIEFSGELQAIEIKKGQTFTNDWLAAFRKWSRWSAVALNQCYVIYGGDEMQTIDDIKIYPWFFI